MIRWLISLLRRRPIVVRTYHVEKQDWLKLHFDKHRQLAKELGRDWPEAR
jgi:hypothetical protein